MYICPRHLRYPWIYASCACDNDGNVSELCDTILIRYLPFSYLSKLINPVPGLSCMHWANAIRVYKFASIYIYLWVSYGIVITSQANIHCEGLHNVVDRIEPFSNHHNIYIYI